jgi:hypothetical protein
MRWHWRRRVGDAHARIEPIPPKPHPHSPGRCAQEACRARGWKYVKLDEKPLHGRQDETPATIVKAREALKEWQWRQAYAADMD